MLIRKIFLPLCAAGMLFGATTRAMANPAYEAGLEAVRQFRYAEALMHFKAAAAQGNRDALRNSGLMLLLGSSLYGAEIKGRQSEAIALLKAAADKGCEISTLILSRLGFYQGC